MLVQGELVSEASALGPLRGTRIRAMSATIIRRLKPQECATCPWQTACIPGVTASVRKESRAVLLWNCSQMWSVPDVQSNRRAWRIAARTGYHQRLHWLVHCTLFFQKLTTTPCLVLLQVKAAQPSGCVLLGLERMAKQQMFLVPW